MIDKKVIEKLKPCKDRYDNYLKFYGDKKFSKRQFMGLKNISQSDKMWVAFRLMPQENVKLAAADIAESVLHIYENQFPNDDRPRKAIEAARRDGKDAAAHARAANAAAYAAASYAHAAAYAADAAAYAAYAASAAANAADAAHAARAAAANAADAARAARAAAYAAAYAASANSNEKQIRTIVLKYWK